MQSLKLTNRAGDLSRLLCLGAHADDIEIGCGGTVLKLAAEQADMEVWWVVFSANGARRAESVRSADVFLDGIARRKVVTHSFRDGFLPYGGAQVKEAFEELKDKFSPDLILTHYRHDLHQDHRLISELTWNTFRDHCILEYEIPKFDGDLGAPNVFVHLAEAICHQKVDALLKCYHTQGDKRWFNKEIFFSLLRLRGMESNAPSAYAEAFYGRKLVL